MSTPVANDLQFDILILVLQSLQDDYHSLSQCALVNHAFYQAASKLLYRKVVLAPRYSLVPSPDGGFDRSNLKSATLPSYAKFVEIIEISRCLSCRPPPVNTLSKIILSAITQFKNLQVAIFIPLTFHEDVFTDTLKYFAVSSIPSVDDNAEIPVQLQHEAADSSRPNLRELVVNTSCTDQVRAPLLIQITGLSKLSIHSPTRAILQLLSDWLHKLSDTLKELHLKDDCGSVTPGVLRSLVPQLAQNIQSLSLGLSYSLTDEDVFSVLHKLQKLETVELRYYWQLRQPVTLPRLERLRSFTAYHINYQTRSQVRSLCKWIRRAITSSPIESLRLIQDDQDQQQQLHLTSEQDTDFIPQTNTGANISFRSLIDHLCSSHQHTLKTLDMKKEYIDVKSLKKLLKSCSELEEIHICAGRHSLTIFKKHSAALHHLRTASFDIRNVPLAKRRIIDMELVTAIMKHGPPLLRRLSVNGQCFESSWKRTKDDTTLVLHIHKYHHPIPPWNRNRIEPSPPPPSPSPSPSEEETPQTQIPHYHGHSPPPPSPTSPIPTISLPASPAGGRAQGILTTTARPPTKRSGTDDGPHVRFREPQNLKSK